MVVDIPIVHRATPRRLRRKWQVANFFCAASSWVAIESRGHAINRWQQQVILRRAAKERLRGRRMSVHHHWVTFFWKKLQVRKWHSLETLQAYSLDISSLPWPKKILHRTQRKIPSGNIIFSFFGDFSTWNASIGDVYNFLVSLIVVRHLFQFLFYFLFINIWGIPQQGIGLPWSRGSPNNVDDMHEQVMPGVGECKWVQERSVMLRVRKGREHGSCC